MTKPAKTRSEGQWALGEREPLNANEEFKRHEDPLAVRDRIENIYAKEGFASIDKTDLRGRFRWWGLYTQREQGYDGTFTGEENTDLLEAPYFMLRVRSDGGALTAGSLRVLGQISTEFARDTADISDRQNVQYHWIRVEDMPEIWRRLDAVGLQTTEACGDCPRVVLGSPLAGESLDEVLDPTPAIEEIVRRYVGKPEYSNLPRKFKTAISGLQDVVHEINDVAFVGVNHPEHGPGLDLWVGGGLSTNPMLAQRLGAWVPLDEVPEVWEAVVSLFRDYGYRRLRSKARMKFLVKDWGPKKFRDVLETEYLKRPLIDGPAPEPTVRPIDHVGVQRLRNGLNAVGVAPIAGRVSGTILTTIADLAEQAGSDRIRFTPYQKLIILDVPDDKVDALVAGLDALGLPARPSHWRRNLMACSGIEFCKLSFAETRVRAQSLVPDLEQRLADLNAALDVPVTVNINGCPNSCARIQVADIGFKGQMVDDGDGPVEGFQVHLGGSLGLDSAFGRKLRQHKVTSVELGDYIERVVRNFTNQREPGERFAQWAIRADEESLR
ncbi:MAG: nitrite/sulfite reductase [Actinomycetota bacterium]|nr:nitrite/sulfite reductase [Actinomycetota bacterium]MDA2948031.1 nitrite/sulfite reductase [Actinomycetota bacterium]